MCNHCIEWNGKVWHRYGDGRGAYYERTDKSITPKRTLRLHREVWIFHRGPVPHGYEIHHRDGDKANNHIDNLECLRKGAHSSFHRALAPIPACDWDVKPDLVVQCVDCGSAVIRKRAGSNTRCIACHRKRADEKRKGPRSCAQCGAAFVSRRGNYCSQRCVNLATHGGTRSVLSEGRRRT